MVAGTLTYDTKMDTKGLQKGVNSIKNIVAGLGITKIISKAFDVLSNSVDGAISRIDTLNNFPKVMSNLGIGAEESQEAIQELSDKLQGIPTKLDDAALAVQRFTSKNGDVKKSVEIFDAVNNAILAGGASSEIQASALEQLSQAYAKGKPDMMEWRTLQTAMPAQLKQVAQAMNTTTDQLGEDLRKGNISMDDFINTMIKLNKQGTGEFKSFSEQARNATGGIRTAITNAKTAVTRGVANIISAINEGLQNAGLGSIAEIITNMGKNAESGLKWVADKVKTYVPIIINWFADGVKKIKTWMEKVNFKQVVYNAWQVIKNFVTQVINGLKPIYEFIKKNIVPTITKMFQSFSKFKFDSKSFEKFNSVLKSLQPLLSTVLAGFLAFKSVIIIKSVLTTVATAYRGFTSLFMTNPFAVVIAATAALATAIAKLARDMDKTTSELKTKLQESSTNVTNQIGKMGDAYNEFGQKLESADSNLDAFNNRLFVTDSEQQKLQDDLSNIQNKITEITAKAHEERRDLTQAEIDKINEYLDKMQEIKKRLAEFDTERQKSIRDQAESELASFKGTEAEYEEMMVRWQNTSSQAAEEAITNVRNSATEQLAYLNSTYTTQAQRETKEYQDRKAAIEQWRDDSIATIQDENAKTIELYSKKYDAEVQADADAVKQIGDLMEKRKKLQDDLNEAEHKKGGWNLLDKKMWTGEYYKVANQSRADLTKVNEQITSMFDEQGLRRIGIWAKEQEALISTGQKMSSENAQMARDIIAAYDNMDEETQAKMKDMVDGLKETLSKSGEPLQAETQTLVEKIGDKLNWLKPNAKKAGEEGTKSFTDAITKTADKQLPWVAEKSSEIHNSLTGGLDNLNVDGKRAAVDFIQGIIDGISSKQGMMYRQVEGVGKSINAVLRGSLGEASPSKKSYQDAVDYIAGFVNGVKDKQKDAYKVVDYMGDNIIDTMSNAVNIEAGKITAKATLNNNVNKAFVLNASFNGNVELDNRKVGKILAPDISRALKVGGL